ncbi:MAG: ABC transporter permease [Betaproteobacteria bacterium 13_1_40CM_4_64_4]|nr:MAG: ABC transporter permease [Betaproteobacteria bacterium 13_1_40CM_4_64_4]
MSYQWDFSGILRYGDMLLIGLVGTVKIAVISIVLGVVVGLLVALLRLSSNPWASKPAGAFIEFYRNTPPIIHFFWFFYALPILIGVNLDPFAAAVLALSTQSGAFYAEVFRGGIVSIERGQWEGARALGMNYRMMMTRIIVPQALRRMVAPFVERSSYAELLYQAMQVNSITFRPMEVYTSVAVLFFVLLFTLSTLMRLVEHRLSRVG